MILIDDVPAKICVDPGHGGSQPGAVGVNLLRECDVALAISKELIAQLSEHGIEGALTRDSDSYVSQAARVEASKDTHAFLSIHCNAGPVTAEGIETLFGSGKSSSKAFANYVQQAMMKACQGHKNRGLLESPSTRYPRNIYVVTQAVVPACLVECEFISHPVRGKWLGESDVQKQIAYALCQGVYHFLLSLPGGACTDRGRMVSL